MREERHPGQFLLVDGVFTWNETTQGGLTVFNKGQRPSNIPPSLIEPVDYRGGTVHCRIEVLHKSSAEPINIMCRIMTERHAKETCAYIGYLNPLITGMETRMFEVPLDMLHVMIEPSSFSLEKPIVDLQVVVADRNGIIVSSAWDKGMNDFLHSPDISRYLPVRARYTALVVAAGATFTGFPM